MRVVWLASYPIELIRNFKLSKNFVSHPASWIVNLSNELSNKFPLELHIITLNAKIKQSVDIQYNGIFFHIIKNSFPLIQRNFPSYFPLNLLMGFYVEKKLIIRKIKKINPDLIHIHGTESALGLATIKLNIPKLISIQGIINEIEKGNRKFFTSLQKRNELLQITSYQNFACRTNFDKGFVLRFNKNANIFHLDEAINPLYFASQWENNENQSILYVGQILEKKGIHTLIMALSLIKMEKKAIILNIIGNGNINFIKSIKKLIYDLKLEKNITFHGFLNATDIIKLQLETTIFVLPTIIDNSPNSLAEAMALGMPVIASKVGGIPSMVTDNYNGILVNERNPDELCKAVLDLLDSPLKRCILGERARETALGRNHPELVAHRTFECYSKILGGK